MYNNRNNIVSNLRNFVFGQDLLETVFENGVLVKEYTFAQVRENAEIPLVKEAKKNKEKI